EGRRRDGNGRAEPRPAEAGPREHRQPGDPRRRRDAALREDHDREADRGRLGLRRPGHGRLSGLPSDFPRDVEGVATDLDPTLMWGEALQPRTLAALARARDAGLRVIVVTGRMVQSLRRVLAPAGLHDPVICYQGAAVVDADGGWLLHRPIE